MSISRRQFLKGAAIAGAGLATSGLIENISEGKTNKPGQGPRYGMVVDLRRCFGCHACSVACKAEQDVPLGSFKSWVLVTEKGQYPDAARNFVPVLCNHCDDPPCVKVCPSGALFHTEAGFVSYNKDICTGCGYCIDFCHFSVPRSERNLTTGVAKMDKCTFCTTPGLDRVDNGHEPSCVKTCPTGALVYGDHDELVAEGGKRVQALRAKGYGNAYLYGDRELGGLHVLYVLDDSPEVYGLPLAPQVPAAAIAWQDVVQPLGWALGGVTILGLGLNYIVAREAKIARGLPAKKEEK